MIKSTMVIPSQGEWLILGHIPPKMSTMINNAIVKPLNTSNDVSIPCIFKHIALKEELLPLVFDSDNSNIFWMFAKIGNMIQNPLEKILIFCCIPK